MSWDTCRATGRTTANGARSKSGSTLPRVCRHSPSPQRAGISRRATSALRYAVLPLLFLGAFLICPFAHGQNPPPILAPDSPPPPPGYTPPGQQPGPDHRLRAAVELVVLHVTVADGSG